MSTSPDRRHAPRRREDREAIASAAHIVRALLTISALAILIAGTGTFLLSYYFLHQQTARHLDTLTGFVASESRTALEFRDRETAREILQSIPADEGIAHAVLSDTAGTTLAEYTRPPGDWIGNVARRVGNMQTRRDVLLDGHRIGSVALAGGTESMVRTLAWLLIWFVIGMLLIAFCALRLARIYTRRFTRPIEQLHEVVRDLITDRDFDRRAPASALAEVEELRSEFNVLLDEIDVRDQMLTESNARLQRMAYLDTLTGLQNRAIFEPALHRTIEDCRRAGQRACLFYLDIDAFKAVNDSLSHEVGDALLRHVADRLRAWRASHTLAARIGGDEFVALLAPMPRETSADALVEELLATLEVPMHLDGGDRIVHPGTSIGAAVYPDMADSAQDLIRQADYAMYAAKKARQRQGLATSWKDAARVLPDARMD